MVTVSQYTQISMLISIISQLEERNPLVPPLRKRGLRGHPHTDSHTATSSMVPPPVEFFLPRLAHQALHPCLRIWAGPPPAALNPRVPRVMPPCAPHPRPGHHWGCSRAAVASQGVSHQVPRSTVGSEMGPYLLAMVSVSLGARTPGLTRHTLARLRDRQGG